LTTVLVDVHLAFLLCYYDNVKFPCSICVTVSLRHNTGSSQTDGRTDRHIATAYIALCRHKPDEKTRVDVVRSLC